MTGNTVIDALRIEIATQAGNASLRAGINSELSQLLGANWEHAPMVLITGHRRENFGDGIEQICRAITILAGRFPNHSFVYPVHLNPSVLLHVNRLLGGLSNVRLIAPQGYRNFVALLAHCRLVLTDSGNPGGGSFPGQAGPGYARHDRAPRGRVCRHRASNRPEFRDNRGARYAAAHGRGCLSVHGHRQKPLWGRLRG